MIGAPECDSPGVSDGRVEPIVDASVSLILRPEVVRDGCSVNQDEKGYLFVEVDQLQSNDDLSMRDLIIDESSRSR